MVIVFLCWFSDDSYISPISVQISLDSSSSRQCPQAVQASFHLPKGVKVELALVRSHHTPFADVPVTIGEDETISPLLTKVSAHRALKYILVLYIY